MSISDTLLNAFLPPQLCANFSQQLRLFLSAEPSGCHLFPVDCVRPLLLGWTRGDFLQGPQSLWSLPHKGIKYKDGGNTLNWSGSADNMSGHITDGDSRSEKWGSYGNLVNELSFIICKWRDKTIFFVMIRVTVATASRKTNLFATCLVVEPIFGLNSGWDVWKLCRLPCIRQAIRRPALCPLNASHSPLRIVAIRNTPTDFRNCLLSGGAIIGNHRSIL